MNLLSPGSWATTRPWKWLQFNIITTSLSLLLFALLSSWRMHHTYGSSQCSSILKGGRYLDNQSFFPHQWQPDGCALHKYSEQTSSNELSSCLLPGDEIIFYGDSTGRQIFHAMGNLIQQGAVLDAKTHSVSFNVKNITISFVWAPFFNDTGNEILKDIAANGLDSDHKADAKSRALPDASRPPKTFLIVSGGLWFARDLGDEAPTVFKERLQSVVDTVLNRIPSSFEHAYFIPVMTPYFSKLTTNQELLTPQLVGPILKVSDEVFGYNRGKNGGPGTGGEIYNALDTSNAAIDYVPVISDLVDENHPGLFDTKGVHFTAAARYVEANILLNHMCNKYLAPERLGFDKDHDIQTFSGTCCVQYPSVPILHLTCVFLAFVLGFGLLLKKLGRAYLPKVLPVLVTVLYVYATERSHTFNTTMLYYDLRNLVIFLQAALFLGLFFTKEGEPLINGSLLSETFLFEFKGVCIAMLILIELTGFDLEFEEFGGAILKQIFYSSWTLLEVYHFTLELIRSVDLSPKEKSLSLGLKFSRLLILPTLLSLVLTYKGGPGLSHFWSSAVGRLFFWYVFALSFQPAIRFCPASLKKYLFLLVVFFGLIIYPISSSITLEETPESISRDYALVFLAVLAAIWGSFSSFQHSLTPSHQGLFVAALGLAMVINTAYVLVPVYFPSITGSSANPSLLECNNDVRETAILLRGAAYTGLSHFFLTLFFVLTWIALRTQISSCTYMTFFTESGKCAYEAIVLRFHVALTAAGAASLWLLPGGSGTVVSGLLKRAYQVIPIDTPLNNFQFPGEFAFHMGWLLNSSIVLIIFALLASSLGSIWSDAQVLQGSNEFELVDKTKPQDIDP